MSILKQEEVTTFARVFMSIDPKEHDQLCRASREVHCAQEPQHRAHCIDDFYRIATRAALSAKTFIDIRDLELDSAERLVIADEIRQSTQDPADSVAEHRKYVGSRIRKVRNSQKLSQQKLADLIGSSQPHISDIENGSKCVTSRTLAKIAHALNVSMYDLDYTFDGVGDRLRSIRLAEDVSIETLANGSRVPARRIEKIEENVCSPTDSEIQVFARVLRVYEEEIDPQYFVRQQSGK
ncbi:MAG: helix-turn-helix transcriptional regulator [Pirellulaceae bacterium]